MASYDVVTLGETMLRLNPPGFRRLEQATTLEVEVGGTESNLAIGLARLGLRVCWLSRLTANPLGRIIAQTIAGHGVDTSRVIWTTEDRVGLLFFEEGSPPRSSRVWYDRQHSAISRMRPEELPEDMFQPGVARVLHLTGITVALGPQAAAMAHRAMALARAAGWLVSFDINYRRQLWSQLEAVQGCEPFAQAADILFIPRGDACTLYGLDAAHPAEHLIAALTTQYPQATIALTLGQDGAIGATPDGDTCQQPAFPAAGIGRLGGGDAFAAGFLYAYLTTPEPHTRLAHALAWGTAMAALKYSVLGDIPIVERAEVEALLTQGGHSPRLWR